MLTLEYCPALKINRVEEIERLGLDRQLLARLSVEAYLQQLLRFGLFHADPHPGNIAVDAGNPGGRLVFYECATRRHFTARARLVRVSPPADRPRCPIISLAASG